MTFQSGLRGDSTRIGTHTLKLPLIQSPGSETSHAAPAPSPRCCFVIVARASRRDHNSVRCLSLETRFL